MRKTSPPKTCAGCGKAFASEKGEAICPDCELERVLAELTANAEKAPQPRFKQLKAIYRGHGIDIWRVRERETGDIYALKTLQPQCRYDRKMVNALLTGTEIGALLGHENVVRTVEIRSPEDEPYHLMELCDGNVCDLMKAHGGRLPLPLATLVFLQVLLALDYLHNAGLTVEFTRGGLFDRQTETIVCGVVHRDIKPGHILWTGNPDAPIVKLAGFDASGYLCHGKLLLPHFDPEDDDRLLCSPGMAAFLPRQQAVNHKKTMPATDVWSAVAIYYYMLTGEYPKPFGAFRNEWNRYATVFSWEVVFSKPPVPIRERDNRIPSALAAVIDQALDDRQELSYASAAALRQDIIAALPEELKLAVAPQIG